MLTEGLTSEASSSIKIVDNENVDRGTERRTKKYAISFFYIFVNISFHLFLKKGESRLFKFNTTGTTSERKTGLFVKIRGVGHPMMAISVVRRTKSAIELQMCL